MGLIEFYNAINRIKHIERTGWKQKGVTGVSDTIASHSFGATLVGWTLAKEEGLDADKIIKMLLIHDLIMAYVPDLTPSQAEYTEKRNIENSYAGKLLEDVPASIKDEFSVLFKEYQEEKSAEAIFARECDKLDTLLQAYSYSLTLEKDIFSEFLKSYKDKIKSKTGNNLIADLSPK